jgi:hypothetical protein
MPHAEIRLVIGARQRADLRYYEISSEHQIGMEMAVNAGDLRFRDFAARRCQFGNRGETFGTAEGRETMLGLRPWRGRE